MATEQYINSANPATTLSGSMDGSTTSCGVTSEAALPAAAQYRIRIDDEIMIVTAGVGTGTLTVTRHAEGTSAASHSAGANVYHVLTAGALDQIRADLHRVGTTADLPTVAKAGDTYRPSDGAYAYRYTGSVWVPYGPSWQLTPPVPGDFVWVNQDTASLISSGGFMTISSPAAGNDNSRLQVKTLPSAPYTITAAISIALAGGNYSLAGLALRQSGDGKLVTLELGYVNGWVFRISKRSSVTSIAGQYVTWGGPPIMGTVLWFRISDDNTNRHFLMSSDGFNFVEITAHSRADYLTADQAGFFCSPGGSGAGMITLWSWKEA